MKLTVLGKYGPYAKANGACSSYLLQVKGKNILIDCGNGALSRLQKYIALDQIDGIFLSHLHFDHVSDLFILRYALEGLRARGTKLQLPILLYMPDSPQPVADLIKKTDVFNPVTITEDTAAEFEGIKVAFCEMTHPVKSFAMRFTACGKTFVYSGDTNMNGNIIPFANNADLLLMEAGLLSKDKKDNTAPHVSVKEAGEIGRKAGVSRLLATHMYPLYSEEEVLAELLEQYANAKIVQENTIYDI
jgi:ribonuclease BN (tRNA processing enzyme)